MADQGVVTSLRNPRVLAARKLQRRSERDATRLFLIEGPGGVRAALAAGAAREVFVGQSAHPAVRDEFAGVALEVSDEVIAALSDTRTPQGVVATAADPSVALEDVALRSGLVVVLAEVRDPGNAGTLIRSAAAAGADAVVFGLGSVDPLNPKCARSSTGALFEIPLVRSVALAEAVAHLKRAGLRLIGADASAGAAPDVVGLVGGFALVLGNEAWGFAPDAEVVLDARVGIPMPGGTESLNVGIAGSILLFEAVRQRSANSR